MASSKFLEFSDGERSEQWFDDQIKRPILVRPTAGGIDTSAIDAWRQGVEIVTMNHFDAGIGKISAGEPGHVLRANSFGDKKDNTISRLLSIMAPVPPSWTPLELNPSLWVQSDYGLEYADYIINNLGFTVTGDEVAGWNFVKNTGADTWYDNHVQSGRQALVGDGYIELVANTVDQHVMVSLTITGDTGVFDECNFSWYLTASGTCLIYEHAASKAGAWAYVHGDVFRITFTSGVVTYTQNGVLRYTSLSSAVYPLHLNVNAYSAGSKVDAVKIVGDIIDCVGTWRDKSNHGNDLTHHAGTRLPTLDTTTYSYATLRAWGGQALYHFPEVTDATSYTHWTVYRMTDAGGTYSDVLRNGTGNFANGWSYFVHTLDYRSAYHTAALSELAPGPSITAIECSIVQYENTGVNRPATFTINDAATVNGITSVAASTMAPGTMFTTVMGTTSYNMIGNFMEAGIVDHVITDAERAELVAYLKRRYRP